MHSFIYSSLDHRRPCLPCFFNVHIYIGLGTSLHVSSQQYLPGAQRSADPGAPQLQVVATARLSFGTQAGGGYTTSGLQVPSLYSSFPVTQASPVTSPQFGKSGWQ